ADQITVQTYHAFAASIVREYALFAGLDGDPALLDRAREWQLMLEALDGCSFELLEIGWLPTFIGKLLTLHDELQHHDLSLERIADWCRARRGDEVADWRLDGVRALGCYGRLKQARNAIDFGDQIRLANELLRSRGE